MKNQVYKVNSIETCKDYKELVFVVAKDIKGNVISICNFENIYPVNEKQEELFVFPMQTVTDKQFWTIRQYLISVVQQLNNKGLLVVKVALAPKQIQDKNKLEDDDIKILEIICGKSNYIDYTKIIEKYPVEKVQRLLLDGKALDSIKYENNNELYACFEPNINGVYIIDAKQELIKKSCSVTGCLKMLQLDNISSKNIELFYKKELNRIDRIKTSLETTEFLSVWDIKQAKRYGFTNEEIAQYSGESLKEINAICIGNDINF